MIDRNRLIKNLYRRMPGAPQPPSDERGELWGEVEGNEYWQHCCYAADLLVDASTEFPE